MVRYLVSRLTVVIPVALFVFLITFTLGYYAPGDPIELIYGEDLYSLREEDLQRMRRNLGLDRPFWEQYLDYMGKTLRGDLGRSIETKVSVNRLLANSLPISLQLGFLAAVVLAVIGIPLGIIAALRHNSWLDYLIVSLALFVRSVPVFVLAPLLLILLVLKLKIMDVPAGWQGIATPRIILPVPLLAAYPLADIIRQTRAGLLEVLQEDYVRTARAKGLTTTLIITRHVLRNALIPVVTSLGLIVNGLIHGSVYLERVFGIPGFGNLVISGVQRLYFPVILGTTIFSTLLVVAANLLVDIVYPFLDPRVTYSGREGS